MTNPSRRHVLKTLAAAPVALAFTWTMEEAAEAAAKSQQARAQAAAAKTPFRPRFFNAHEYATIAALGDMILPKDARSGSATDAGVPEFIDYIVAEQPARQVAMRGGLQWLDRECLRRFDRKFLACAEADRRLVLDDIAWPRRARPAMSQGVRFFTTMRDLVATGFWSSKVGVTDLGYMGNVMLAEWPGAPDAVLQKLGVRYE